MQTGLIKLTQRFVIQLPEQNEVLNKVTNEVYYFVISVMNQYHAKNLDYFIDGSHAKTEFEASLKKHGNTVVEILNRHFPVKIDFKPELQIPLLSASIKIIAIEKSTIDTFRFELYLTSNWLTVIDSLPSGLLIAIGDCSEAICNGSEIDTFMYPYKELIISTYQSIHK